MIRHALDLQAQGTEVRYLLAYDNKELIQTRALAAIQNLFFRQGKIAENPSTPDPSKSLPNTVAAALNLTPIPIDKVVITFRNVYLQLQASRSPSRKDLYSLPPTHVIRLAQTFMCVFAPNNI